MFKIGFFLKFRVIKNNKKIARNKNILNLAVFNSVLSKTCDTDSHSFFGDEKLKWNLKFYVSHPVVLPLLTNSTCTPSDIIARFSATSFVLPINVELYSLRVLFVNIWDLARNPLQKLINL